jgi:hypothetical protein
MSVDDTLTLEPTPPAASQADIAARLREQREAVRRQQSLRSEYLRAVSDQAKSRAAAHRTLVRGVLFLAIGLVVTVATYSHAATDGGIYVVAWGPVIFGLIQIVRGLSAR